MGQILDGMLHTLDEKSPIWCGSPGYRMLTGHAGHLRRDKTIADSPCQTQAQHTHAHFPLATALHRACAGDCRLVNETC